VLSTPQAAYGTFVPNNYHVHFFKRFLILFGLFLRVFIIAGSFFTLCFLGFTFSVGRRPAVPHQLISSPFSHFVILQRHCRSSWENQSLTDFQRPLLAHSLLEANRIGRYFADHTHMGGVWEQAGAPDLVVCSSSVRTRQTLSGWVNGFCEDQKDCSLDDKWVNIGTQEVPVHYERGIYDARNGSDLLKYFIHTPSNAKTLLLVGHSTALDELVGILTGGPSMVRFATCGMALLGNQLAGNDWKRPGTFWLLDYVNPSVLTTKN